MKPNEQSWPEWWQGHAPKQSNERFLIDLTTWSRGGQVELSQVDFSPIEGYPYLLHHLDTDQLIYWPSPPVRCNMGAKGAACPSLSSKEHL